MSICVTCFDEMIEYIQEQYADRTAFLYTQNGEQKLVTYDTFYNDVSKLSSRFTQKGMPIGLLGENRYEWIVTYFAIQISGNTVIPLDNSANLETLISEMDNARCSNIFYTERYSSYVQEIQNSYTRPLSTFLINNILEDDCSPFSLYSQNTSEEAKEIRDLFKGASVVIYTSGTTSKPKGVLLTQQSIIANAVSAAKLVQFYPRILVFLPLYHALGFTGGVVIPLLEGCTVILNNENYSILQNIQSSGAESLLAVPAMVKMFKDAIVDTQNDTSLMGNIKQIICGGAALAPELYDFFEDIHIAIQIGYGLSECSCAVSVNGNSARRRNAVGQVLDCCSVMIQDPDQNGCGEILVTGKNVMLGYLNAPDLTEKAFDGGYFKSGDLGYLDDDGFIYITGRCKNILVMSNGKKIAPEELENYIGIMPHVKEVLVFLLDRDEEHELIAAEIYVDPQTDSDESRQLILEAIDKLNRDLPIYKRIQRIYFRDNEFEKTATHKIVRKPVVSSIHDAEQKAGGVEQTVFNQIADMIRKLTDVPDETIAPDSELFNDLGLDSLYYATLMCQISELYGVTISEAEYRSIRTVHDITSIVQKDKVTT